MAYVLVGISFLTWLPQNVPAIPKCFTFVFNAVPVDMFVSGPINRQTKIVPGVKNKIVDVCDVKFGINADQVNIGSNVSLTALGVVGAIEGSLAVGIFTSLFAGSASYALYKYPTIKNRYYEGALRVTVPSRVKPDNPSRSIASLSGGNGLAVRGAKYAVAIIKSRRKSRR